MSLLNEIELVQATAGDFKRVEEFLRNEFFPKQPVKSLNQTSEFYNLQQDFIDQTDTHIMALHKDKLVGVLVTGPVVQHHTAQFQGLNDKMDDLLSLLDYCEKKADLFQQFDVKNIYFIHIVAVATDYGGQKIGEKLFQKGLELAKDSGYKIVAVDCTSYYTSKIAIKLGMVCAGEVTYEEYHKMKGQDIFVITPPHTSVKTFIKRFD